LYLN
jgi:hypothetical protein